MVDLQISSLTYLSKEDLQDISPHEGFQFITFGWISEGPPRSNIVKSCEKWISKEHLQISSLTYHSKEGLHVITPHEGFEFWTLGWISEGPPRLTWKCGGLRRIAADRSHATSNGVQWTISWVLKEQEPTSSPMIWNFDTSPQCVQDPLRRWPYECGGKRRFQYFKYF